jgi:hypothetical protein
MLPLLIAQSVRSTINDEVLAMECSGSAVVQFSSTLKISQPTGNLRTSFVGFAEGLAGKISMSLNTALERENTRHMRPACGDA